MIRHEVLQGTEPWLRLRAGIPTASEFDALISPLGKIRTGDGPETYLHRKLAECIVGGPLFTGGGSWQMDQGSMLEGEAIPYLEFQFGWKVERVGFITTDDGRIGCSPDGLIGEDNGLEIKCPELHTHVGYLLGGEVPKQYWAQVQGALWITGRPKWTFVSYHRQLPPLIVNVERDGAFQEAMENALAAFLAKFETAKARLEEIRGK